MLSLKCYVKEAVTLAHTELQNVVCFSFLFTCYVWNSNCASLWLLMHGVLTQLKMLILKSCSRELRVKYCKAQA